MGGVLLAIVPVVMIILPTDKSKLFHCSIILFIRVGIHVFILLF